MNNWHADLIRGLPRDWPVRQLSDIADRIEAGGTPSRVVPTYWHGQIPWVTPGELTNLGHKYLHETRESISTQGLGSSGATLLPKDSLLVTTRATLGSRALAARPMATNQGFKSIVFNNIANPNFYFHFFQLLLPELIRRSSGTTFLEISGRQFSQITVPVPPLAEQRRIAEILDTADEEIRSTERLIAKLEQGRQGLLHDLLARCVHELSDAADADGKVRMTQLAEVCDLQVGFAFKSEWFRGDRGIRLLRGENAGYGAPDWSDTRYLTEVKAREFEGYLLDAGDMVVGMDRAFTKSGFKVSRLAVEDTPSLLVQRVGRFQPHLITGDFLWCLLNSEMYQSQLSLRQIGMDIPHLSKADILSPVICIPELETQGRIADVFLAFERRVCSESRYLAGLHAMKQGLMDDLLTGRVRVSAAEGASA